MLFKCNKQFLRCKVWWCSWCMSYSGRNVGSVRKFSLETAFWHNIQYLILRLMTCIKMFTVEKLQIKSARYSLLHSLVCSAIITLLTWFPDFHARCSQLTLCVTLNHKLLDADIVISGHNFQHKCSKQHMPWWISYHFSALQLNCQQKINIFLCRCIFPLI